MVFLFFSPLFHFTTAYSSTTTTMSTLTAAQIIAKFAIEPPMPFPEVAPEPVVTQPKSELRRPRDKSQDRLAYKKSANLGPVKRAAGKRHITSFPLIEELEWRHMPFGSERSKVIQDFLDTVMLPPTGIKCPSCDYCTKKKAELGRHMKLVCR